MFAGVRYDIEIGLYYNRARYYNPFTGRFLQTDPIADGMNLYAYCGNNPLCLADPSGLSYRFLREDERVAISENYRNRMVFADVNGGDVTVLWDGNSIDGWIDGAPGYFGEDWAKQQSGWTLAGCASEKSDQAWWFWRIKALMYLDPEVASLVVAPMEKAIKKGHFSLTLSKSKRNFYTPGEGSGALEWDPECTQLYPNAKPQKQWYTVHPLAMLAHELGHARDASVGGIRGHAQPEVFGVIVENHIREALFQYDPTQSDLYPRPGYTARHEDLDATSADRAWKRYRIKGAGRSVVY
jgi:RHS repeat-associated protein